MPEYKVEYKQQYLRGYFPVKSILKHKYKQEITPNEYYQKYVTKIDDSIDTYQRVSDMDEGKTYLYRMVGGYKYLVSILPVITESNNKEHEEEE